MIDTALINETLHSFGNIIRIRSVQLQAPGQFAGAEVGKSERLIAAFNQRTRIDHFADEKPGAEFFADEPEWIISHTGHRGQNHGRPDG